MTMAQLGYLQITAVAVTIAAVIAIIGLVVYNRRAVAQTRTLRDIDSKLTDHLENASSHAVEDAAAEAAPEEPAQPADAADTSAAAEEHRRVARLYYDVARSGRAYSKQELETQIKE